MDWRRIGILLIVGCITSQVVMAQGFLHADGTQIVDGEGENVILRGIGTGNWMLQEGYMMKCADTIQTQHEFRENLVNTIGEVKTDSFYAVWLENHFTRIDVDSMASWGFNSVRVALHYKWFTLPIEEEPVPGEQTWLNKGFEMTDSLLDWCGDNEMYLILDLHGAPGGQGKNADISDYDPTKPSLWESQENKDKTVALWKRLAERYHDEPWIGGYDLINETNWSFPEGNNSQMRSLYERITDSIRTVDQNHIIFIEGNWFANDFSGLTPNYWDHPDDNLVYSFHKYWTYNRSNSLDWVTNLRFKHQVPIWLGETGENSNHWFTKIISLCESQNIGWSMWPVKKAGINNPLRVEINEDYEQLIDNWRGRGPYLNEEEAFQAVLTFADRHRIENCHFQRDVVDAMIRQPHTTEVLSFRQRTVKDTILASEYDMGRNGFAYVDQDTANYHLDMNGEYIAWNQGWHYRSDGVDIEPSKDNQGNGYSVGWTGAGEWLAYTLKNDSIASFSMEVRSASETAGGQIHVEVNGVDVSGPVSLPVTGNWYNWKNSEFDNVILPEGVVQIKVVFDKAGSNLNYFRFFNPQSVSLLPFEFVSAKTAELTNEVYVTLSKEVTSLGSFSISDFTLIQDGKEAFIDSVRLSEKDTRVMIIHSSTTLMYGQSITVTYRGNTIMHEDQPLISFELKTVQNLMARQYDIPCKIEAEDFYFNNGLELEDCSDAGGGLNTGYAHPDDYLDYILNVQEAGKYAVDFRIATEKNNARLNIQADTGNGFESLQTISFARTGGWQIWSTQTTTLQLEAGKYIFRLLVTGEEHNLNWLEFKSLVSAEDHPFSESFRIYPNPASDQIHVTLDAAPSASLKIEILDSMGRKVYDNSIHSDRLVIDASQWPDGLYFVRLGRKGDQEVRKLIVN